MPASPTPKDAPSSTSKTVAGTARRPGPPRPPTRLRTPHPLPRVGTPLPALRPRRNRPLDRHHTPAHAREHPATGVVGSTAVTELGGRHGIDRPLEGHQVAGPLPGPGRLEPLDGLRPQDRRRALPHERRALEAQSAPLIRIRTRTASRSLSTGRSGQKKRQPWRESSRLAVTSRFDRHVLPALGSRPLNSIRPRRRRDLGRTAAARRADGSATA